MSSVQTSSPSTTSSTEVASTVTTSIDTPSTERHEQPTELRIGDSNSALSNVEGNEESVSSAEPVGSPADETESTPESGQVAE
ncbi:unnamed protein product [Trichobilharzia regenti]|nr:unnamed protein product [Trichobilharzia regenti]